MQEIFEKIKGRLQLERGIAKRYLDFKTAKTYGNAIEIVNQVVEETDKGKISDGYHTFNELYHHRAVLFSVICNSNKELAWKSKKHDTGDMYDGMFIVGIQTPEGQATYHYDIEPYWNMFEIKELPNAPKWDGHTPDEAIRRISLLNKYSNSEVPNMSENLTSSDEFCEWKQDDEGADIYYTECENCHMFIDGSPSENKYKFCPYCGKKVKVVE